MEKGADGDEHESAIRPFVLNRAQTLPSAVARLKWYSVLNSPLGIRKSVDSPQKGNSIHEVSMTLLITGLAIVLYLEQIVETAQKIIVNCRNNSHIN
jgi:hypothetical protein